MTTSTPGNLKYTRSHEWVRQEEDNIITIGITEHAQSLLGDIVFVELPEVTKILTAGDACAVVESVKAAADVYAPVSGEVIEVNNDLETTPELVNASCYEGGWLYKARVTDQSTLSKLLDAEAYQSSIQEE